MKTLEDILERLNEQQKEAVTTTEGYVRVIAGAGSGKTGALTARYMYLVEKLGISTENILCVTFTNKAAKEMKKRIHEVLGDKDTGQVCTFHGFCNRFLREEIGRVLYPERFIILDIEDTESIIRQVYDNLNVPVHLRNVKETLRYISARKADQRYIGEIVNTDNTTLLEKVKQTVNIDKQVFWGYLYEQKKNFCLDFDDLINFALYLLNRYEDLKEKWSKRMQYIMVDEFQDVNKRQYELVEILSGYHDNLFIVGDPDQTIYSWRGANVEYILNFDKCFPECQTIMMNTNYRSTAKILSAANELISTNTQRVERDLVPTKFENIDVIYNHCKSADIEAKWIAKQIQELTKEKYSYNDITILYRAHYVSRSIEQALMREKIDYTLYNGVEFYKRKEVKDALCYLRMITHQDNISFRRVVNEPKRNFGAKRLEFIEQYARRNNCSLYEALKANLNEDLIRSTKVHVFVEAIESSRNTYKGKKVNDILDEVLAQSGYEAYLRESGENERLDNLAELKVGIAEYEEKAGEEVSLEEYLQNIALYSGSDLEGKKQSIKLMTVHAAKGLEFPCVFLCGFNEGIFPGSRVNKWQEMEEERRLAYVAYTRAEERLFISEAEGRSKDESFRYPSRFIFETCSKNLKYTVPLPEELEIQAIEKMDNHERNMYRSKVSYRVGDMIKHDTFGVGEIQKVVDKRYYYEIKFDNSSTIRNISFETNLKRINTGKVNLDKRGSEEKDISNKHAQNELKAEITKLKKEITAQNENIEKLNKYREERNAYKKQVSQLKNEQELLDKKLQTDKELLKTIHLKEIAELKNSIDKLVAENHKLQTDMKQLEVEHLQEINTLRASIENLVLENHSLKESNSMLETTKERLTGINKIQLQQCLSLSEQLKEIKTKITQLEDAKVKEESKLLDLQHQLEDVCKMHAAEMKRKKEEIEVVNKKYHELEVDFDKKNNEVAELKEKYATIVDKQLSIHHCINDVIDIKQQLDVLNVEVDKYKWTFIGSKAGKKKEAILRTSELNNQIDRILKSMQNQ